ncbi:site-2 protease family protein [Anaerosalibacter bizertensis]|uniref:Site-2 protease family protein n=1 Tax=Anaerosalibacter bizertensis TaxID=932217 RepID=A0A9Q4AB24_9FIRM|nr:site-2 protease family protein [Anaerosalibacter bizertensis]MBV1817414.1 site-2 protease family protein [Bacteroidales bacterium MSK.15.36]HHV27730.1 site-2 protease family protein [Tissierellia bacterium]MCB5558494.1 site-2 protease family protein [Anaerosalibacter bizertensis]MCG4564258.1 site-2 protease family protein [Anaerosalibacter bizertensis]MCG4581689.1 site-2 protease family protein [Anaerosalibacter bizertensis]
MVLEKLISLPGLLIAIIFHELAHGYTAYKLGDPTAKESGRLTINPLKHIDVVGFLFMLIFRFGWAKPVPINPSYFKHRKRDTILVSLAGPMTNFIIAIISALIISANFIENAIIIDILVITLWYNIMLGVFNLLPFPPLDGSKIIASILPEKWEYKFYKYERYFYLILVFLIISDTIDKILGPLINMSLNILLKIVT